MDLHPRRIRPLAIRDTSKTVTELGKACFRIGGLSIHVSILDFHCQTVGFVKYHVQLCCFYACLFLVFGRNHKLWGFICRAEGPKGVNCQFLYQESSCEALLNPYVPPSVHLDRLCRLFMFFAYHVDQKVRLASWVACTPCLAMSDIMNISKCCARGPA